MSVIHFGWHHKGLGLGFAVFKVLDYFRRFPTTVWHLLYSRRRCVFLFCRRCRLFFILCHKSLTSLSFLILSAYRDALSFHKAVTSVSVLTVLDTHLAWYFSPCPFVRLMRHAKLPHLYHLPCVEREESARELQAKLMLIAQVFMSLIAVQADGQPRRWLIVTS